MFSAPTEGTKHWFRKKTNWQMWYSVLVIIWEGEHFPWGYKPTSLEQIPLAVSTGDQKQTHILWALKSMKEKQHFFYGNKFTCYANLLLLPHKVHSVSQSIGRGQRQTIFTRWHNMTKNACWISQGFGSSKFGNKMIMKPNVHILNLFSTPAGVPHYYDWAALPPVSVHCSCTEWPLTSWPLQWAPS